jgi:hypothetical protein
VLGHHRDDPAVPLGLMAVVRTMTRRKS